MSESLFDVFVNGELIEGADPQQVITTLAQLFKIPPEKAAQIIRPGRRRLKSQLGMAEAQKYRAALHKAGVLSEVKPAAIATPPPSQPASPTRQPASTLSLAPSGSDVLSPEERERPPVAEVDVSQYELAPPSPLPAAPETPAIEVDESQFSIAPSGSDMLPNRYRDRTRHEAPDTEHLSMAEAGETIETLPKEPPPPPPSTQHLTLDDE